MVNSTSTSHTVMPSWPKTFATCARARQIVLLPSQNTHVLNEPGPETLDLIEASPGRDAARLRLLRT
jgi:hypothetical protein